MKRKTSVFAIVGVLLLLAPRAFAQAPAGLAFEVASVKPAAPIALTAAALTSGKLHIGMAVVGTRVDIGYVSLADLIRMAYDVKPYQVAGPDWMTAARFDITAKLPDGATKDQVNECLRALLADRFKLAVHHESRERPIYALIVGKGGSKLKPSEPEVVETDPEKADAAKKDAPAPMLVVGGQSVTQTRDGMGAVVSGGPGGPVKVTMGPAGEHFEAARMTLAAFADMVTPMVDRTVVDMTDLKGTYQLTFDVPLADLMAMASKVAAMSGIAMPTLPPGIGGGSTGGGSSAPSAADPTGASIFQSVQEMGLKLDGRQAPTDVIVIDHLEKAPTED